MTICFAGPDRLIAGTTDDYVAITLHEQAVTIGCCTGTPNRIAIAALKNEITLIGYSNLELSICCSGK
jgi:hypothetical protein